MMRLVVVVASVAFLTVCAAMPVAYVLGSGEISADDLAADRLRVFPE